MIDGWPTSSVDDDDHPRLSRRHAASFLPAPITPLGATLLWREAVLPGWVDALSWLQGDERWPAAGTVERELTDADAHRVGRFVNGYLYLDDAYAFPAAAGAGAPLAHRLDWLRAGEDWPALAIGTAIAHRARATRPELGEQLDVDLVERVDRLIAQLRGLARDHVVASWGLHAACDVAAAGADDGSRQLEAIEPALRVWDLSRTVRASPVLTAIFAQDESRGIPGELVDRLDEEADVADVRAFHQAMTWLVDEFGALGPNGWDVVGATWQSRPELALAAVSYLRALGDDADPRLRVSSSVAREPSAVNVTGRFVHWRGRTRANVMTVVAELRWIFAELGQRWSAAGHLREPIDALMLAADELREAAVEPGAFSLATADRHELWRALAVHEPPAVIDAGAALPEASAVPQRLAARSRARRSKSIAAAPGAPGTAVGPSRVLGDPAAVASMMPGEIAVIANAEPAWVPAIAGATGVVVESDGENGHAVIACRQLGVPCVVGAEHATRQLRDGTTIDIDGTAGTVRMV